MAPGAFPVSGLWRQSLPAGCVSLRRRFQQPAMSRPSVTMPASAAARATSNRPPVSGIMRPGRAGCDCDGRAVLALDQGLGLGVGAGDRYGGLVDAALDVDRPVRAGAGLLIGGRGPHLHQTNQRSSVAPMVPSSRWVEPFASVVTVFGVVPGLAVERSGRRSRSA